MIDGSERLVIVTGMMLSGTTILAHLLCQHPDLKCVADDRRHLETSLLRNRDLTGIAELLGAGGQNLLKCPQREPGNIDWLADELPNARFIYTWKTLDSMRISWAKPTAPQIPGTGEDYYDAKLAEAEAFAGRVSRFRRVFHGDLLDRPKEVLDVLTDWLGLAPHEYDVSNVSTDVSIKVLLGGEAPDVGELIP